MTTSKDDDNYITIPIPQEVKRARGPLANSKALVPVRFRINDFDRALIKAEADEIDVLAQTAEEQDVMYSSKRVTESFSRKTRARNARFQAEDSSIDPDTYLN